MRGSIATVFVLPHAVFQAIGCANRCSRMAGAILARISLDRLSREVRIAENLFYKFDRLGVKVLIVDMPFYDSANRRDVLVRQIREAIAEDAFTTGRFVLDWRLDPKAGHLRYRRWVRNSAGDPQQKTLIATLDGAIVGFFVVETDSHGRAYWHLTAIASQWRHRGMGKRLWAAIIALHYAEGVQKIETTISAHNVAVMNLYARYGFKFEKPQMTFHWLRL